MLFYCKCSTKKIYQQMLSTIIIVFRQEKRQQTTIVIVLYIIYIGEFYKFTSDFTFSLTFGLPPPYKA